MPSRRLAFFTAVALLLGASGCITPHPPTDTGDPVASSPLSPTAPTSDGSTPTPTPTPAPVTDPVSTALAYNPDMKTLFTSDCVICHGSSRADGNYRMSTYAQVMTDVRPGNASSTLVTITQSNGRMYRYFSGSTATRQAKAAQIRSWVVTYNAQENR